MDGRFLRALAALLSISAMLLSLSACAPESGSPYGWPYAAYGFRMDTPPTQRQMDIAHQLLDGEDFPSAGVEDMAEGWPNSTLFELVTVAEMLLDEMAQRYGVGFALAGGYHMPEMFDRDWRVVVTPTEGRLAGRRFTASYVWDMTGVYESMEPFFTDTYFASLRAPEFRDYIASAVDDDLARRPDVACVYEITGIWSAETPGQWTVSPDAPVEELARRGFAANLSVYISPETPLDQEAFDAFAGGLAAALRDKNLSLGYSVYQMTGALSDYGSEGFTIDAAAQACMNDTYSWHVSGNSGSAP